MTVTHEDETPLTRTQRRLLRRIYNGRSIPIFADGTPFLTYKQASQYLLSLEPDARNAAYAAMKEQAKSRNTKAQAAGGDAQIGASANEQAEQGE